MNTLADQVVEFTITLVRALGRLGQLDPAKANFPRARARLLKELVRLQRTQPEIGYVIGPPAVAGGPPELWVDGTGPQRVELRRIIGPSIGGAFILQLLEHMQQHGLVGLAFARGITEAEWNTYIEAASAAPVEKSPAAEGRRLARVLFEKKVRHIACVRDELQPPPKPEAPWPLRIAYARLSHDLRVAALSGTAPSALFDQAEAFAAGAAYSYFRKLDVMRALLYRIGTVDELLRDTPALKSVRAIDIFVRGLPPLSLHGTTDLILKESEKPDQPPPEPAASVLRCVAERLLKTPPSRRVDETLRALCRRKIVPMTRLPVELQEWVLAETWVEALRTEPSKDPPKGGPESSPVRILQKGARHAFIQRMPVQATGILERIKTVSPKSVPEVFDVATVEAVLADFPEKSEDRRGLLALLHEGADTAADSVAAVLVAGETKVAQAAAWILTEMKARGVNAALRALHQDIEREETVRLLLACVSGKAKEDAADAFIKQLGHKSARVRRDALTALAAASPNAAEVYVASALSDPDENVRIRALLLCANTGLGSTNIIPKAIQLVSKDARGAPPQVVRAAIEVVVRRREAGALPIADAEAALCRLATPIGFFGRMLGKKTPPATVLVTAIAALARLGTEKAEKLLARLARSKDIDVAEAAQRELTQKGSRAPLTPMPMVDSSVVVIKNPSGEIKRPSGEIRRPSGEIKRPSGELPGPRR